MSHMPIILGVVIARLLFDCSLTLGAAAPVPLLITFGSLSERETAIFVARDYGLFAKQGLDVRAVHVRNGAVALSALANGEAQFYMGAATGSTLGAIANGLDAVFVTSLIHKLEGTFVVNAAIKSPAELKGKTVGVTSIGGGIWRRSLLAFEHWGLEPQRDKINLRVVGDESLLAQALPNRVIDGAYFNYTFASVLERQGFRVLADLAKLNIPYQNTALLGLRKYFASSPETTERVLRALSEAVNFVLDPKNKERVLQSMAKGLRLAKVEDAVGGYDRLPSMYQRKIFPNVDGIRSTIRFLGPANEKIRALKAEDLVGRTIREKIGAGGTFLDFLQRVAEIAGRIILEGHPILLEQDPREETRNRFRLRRISEHADCELRVDPWRVFYRVQDMIVTVELIGQKKGNVLLIEGREFKL